MVRFFSFLHAVVGIMAVIAWWSVPWLPGNRAGIEHLLPGGPGFLLGGLWGILGLLFTWLTWKELRGRRQ